LADIFRVHGPGFLASRTLPPHVADVLRDIIACRTAALGWHMHKCDNCGHEIPVYNPCDNRHCPICQHRRQQKWIKGRMRRLLPTHHFHVVFTLPKQLRALVLANPKLVLPILFEAASSTLLTLGGQRLDGDIGITAVLHTWARNMQYHPHLHCIVTGGAYDADMDRWTHADKKHLFPVPVMRELFRGRFLHLLQKARDKEELSFVGGCKELEDPVLWAGVRDGLYGRSWVVYAKRPFKKAPHLVRYLGAYTHRVAISGARLLDLSDESVTIGTRGDKTATMKPQEFIRRFLLHVLPPGFTKIRHYGLYASTNVNRKLPKARDILIGVGGEPYESIPDLTEPYARTCPACGVGRLVRGPAFPNTTEASPRVSRRQRCRGPPPALPRGMAA